MNKNQKVILTVLAAVILIAAGWYTWKRYTIPSDIPLGKSYQWSRPRSQTCSWSNLNGQKKEFSGYEVYVSRADLSLIYLEDQFTAKGWKVDNQYDATIRGGASLSKGNRYVELISVASDGTPTGKLADISVCYSR